MQGKTHATVGAATALLFSPTATLSTFGTTAFLGIVGALMPDTDIRGSLGSKATKKIAADVASVCVAFAVGIASKTITVDETIFTNCKSLISGLALIGLCIFGSTQPHRGIMHSLPMMALASFLMWVVNPTYVLPFVIGYASHLVLDVLNYKGEQLLFPLKKKFSLGLCKSDGIVNNILLVVGLAGCVALAYFSATGIMF